MNQNSIAILTWGLSAGSLANYSTALASGFRDTGVKEIYLVYISSGPGKYVSIPEEVKLVPLQAKRSRLASVYISRFLKEVKPDILISVSAFVSISAIVGWLLAGKGPTKLIVSNHSTMSYKAYIEMKHDWRVRLQPLLARLLYPFASGLHANSQVVLDDLLTNIKVPMPLERTIATPNPVNIKAIANYAKLQPEHSWLIQKKHPVILSVARLAKQKNFSLLFEAFKLVRQKLDAKLIVLGEGSERKNLERIVSKLSLEQDVSLPGSTSNPWSSMARADVFVLPSEEEPFGLVLVEAMICGAPIVATDAIGGGPRDVLDSGKYGILCPSNSKEALAEAILKVINSQDVREQLIAGGKKRCKAFTPEVIAQQWHSFIRQLQS